MAGRRYAIIVDGFEGAVGSYTLGLSCSAATICGNDTLEPGEECDDGNTGDGDGCSAICELEGGTCAAGFSVSCGAMDAWSTTGPGSTDRVDEYACVGWNETGREYTYQFTAAADADVTVTLTPDGLIDLDVFVLLDASGGCVAGNCVAYGGTTATFAATVGSNYYVVVDGFGGDEGSYTISFDCGAVAAGE
jgi:cysteine-rich repeat protein